MYICVCSVCVHECVRSGGTGSLKVVQHGLTHFMRAWSIKYVCTQHANLLRGTASFQFMKPRVNSIGTESNNDVPLLVCAVLLPLQKLNRGPRVSA